MTDGKGAYGTIHVMEEEMRAAGQGVFEDKSGEAGRPKAAPAPENKMEPASENKAAAPKRTRTRKAK